MELMSITLFSTKYWLKLNSLNIISRRHSSVNLQDVIQKSRDKCNEHGGLLCEIKLYMMKLI